MATSCDFCRRPAGMTEKTIYEAGAWFAFLCERPLLRGHTILAVASNGACPQTLDADTLRGLDAALAETTRILTAHYQPKRVLFASLRAKDPHIHLHVFPVAEEDEQRWRQEKGEGYETGRFFEFLGEREKAVNHGLTIEVPESDLMGLKALAESGVRVPRSPVLPDE